jgi:hypothetical protein
MKNTLARAAIIFGVILFASAPALLDGPKSWASLYVWIALCAALAAFGLYLYRTEGEERNK